MSKDRILKLPEMGDHRKQQSHCYSQSNKEVRRPLQKKRPMILNALRNPKRQRPSYPSFRGATTVNDYIFVIVMSLPSAFPPRNLLRMKEKTHRKNKSWWKLLNKTRRVRRKANRPFPPVVIDSFSPTTWSRFDQKPWILSDSFWPRPFSNRNDCTCARWSPWRERGTRKQICRSSVAIYLLT